jgi:hypothetical protein
MTHTVNPHDLDEDDDAVYRSIARIVNPYNLDVEDDDALFAGALSQGLIWIECDDDYDDSYESQIEQLESSSETKVHIFKEHNRSVNNIAVSGDFAISASADRTLGVWNWKTGEHLHKLRGHKASVNAVVTSEDFAVSASSDKTIRVWNWKTGERLHTTNKFPLSVTGLDIHDDVVVVSLSNEVWILNWQTREVLQKLPGLHSTDVISVSIRDDLVFSMSWQLLLVRNWKTGEIIHKMDVDYSQQRTGIFLNKEFAVFGGYDSVEVWDWKSGDYLDESCLRDKSNVQINRQAFPTSFGVFIYSLKSAKWCRYYVDAAYDQATVLVNDYSQMITADHGGWIYVIAMNPSLKRSLKKNYNFVHRKSKQKEPTPDHQISDILQETVDFIRKRNEEWVNFTRVSQHLYNTFDDLNLKKLSPSHKSYKSLVKLIADYPDDFELRQDPDKQGLYWIRYKSSKSGATQRKRETTAKVTHGYDTDDVLHAVRDFVRNCDEDWVNFSYVVSHMYKTFPGINLKKLQRPDKSCKSLLKLIAGYPTDYELRQDPEKNGLYWIRLK